MEFATEDDARNYSVGVTAKHIHPDDIHRRLDEYKSYLASARDENKVYWQEEVNRLEEWINSDEFINREYPRGIDELVLELIEWRAAIYAFQKVDTKNNPFKKHAFYAQWLVGGTYTIFCLLGKLVSKDSRDNSLRQHWDMVSRYVAQSGLCGETEIEFINSRMHRTQGQFTNENSQAMKYRNKVIAHNESLPGMEWDELDKDIELISRMWSLITMWSSFGLIEPFRKAELVFSGTESVFTNEEIRLLKEQRDNYLSKVKFWCTRCIETGDRVVNRSPFGKFSISISVDGK
ncbi:hypothetical protein JF535_04820 [Microbulbifer salipaludis]|uniref:Apea-like HEPN domain-containing protein n=1 Tax=Microbulbifer salipaludis TaxID=187980 RepID=A0ABS3E4E5_9GAMM|nr:hypothetical protein [Microbulbifer salipaludis]MBN8430173.1 hypothetical protein [Microbulbifer salipaludis]